MKQECGKLLYKGVRGTYLDTVRGHVKMFVSAVLNFCFLIVAVLFVTFSLGWRPYGSMIVPMVMIIGIIVIFSMVIFALGGFDIDGIYDNGISSCCHTLYAYIKKETFHSYKNITKIGTGTRILKGKKSQFIVIYEHNSKQPTIPNYTEAEYKNDFYQKLIEILKQKCPHAKWEEVDWYSLSSWKK